MRSYPTDSPRAAARVVALSLLADGHLGAREFAAVRDSALARRLDLDADALQCVLHELVEDLLTCTGAAWHDGGPGPGFVDAALAEVRDTGLRREVLDLCSAVAQADGHVSEGERALLTSVARGWKLAPLEPA
ncbi:TerB family tellurite resistance protein [Ramlibacter aquaticus]|uniref:TerB family tellurite resistance protein n=2 Tax=Ramlibacter TaxID=174951 RepID=A0ABR9SGM9_9BURK|nr:TerB family tellurite resistance protein [Ramlibacter aquaticus]MBE7941511.1 TerB family tellurite resistance protein [Ramlibacter aquaticus]